MLRTHYSKDIPKVEGSKVKVAGFVETVREVGKICFLILRDRYGTIQITTKEKNFIKMFKDIPRESFIAIEGNVTLNQEARNGFEIIPTNVEIITKAEKPLPIDFSGKIKTTLEKRIDWRFLDMRNPKNMAIFLLQSEIVALLTEFMHRNNFVRIFTSRLTDAATEGGAEYFKVLYFDKTAYLAQSPQLYKEAILASGIDRVYDIGFVYRAEPHHTPRHLCEYASFDIEMVCKSLDEILDMEENLIKFIFSELNKRCEEILKMYKTKLETPEKIPRIEFKRANKILKSLGIERDPYDLTSEGEKALCNYCKEKYGTSLAFVTEFPFKKKPFYLMKKDNELCYSFDLLFNGMEITSGGVREHRYEERVKNIIEKGLSPEHYDHLRFWKYGMPPHGGFAIGIERLTLQILGLENIREVTLLPRDPERLKP
ncbi:MAG: aspartate--tRNA(Asn) ligase [Candidatus Aenigmatarchaeota archaeon]|nr:aspartate--tRNA(Asn) ligase [Candidatus Aenigmarchaeota archaeon]